MHIYNRISNLTKTCLAIQIYPSPNLQNMEEYAIICFALAVFTLAGGMVESTSPPPRAQVLRQHAGLYADKSRSEFQEPWKDDMEFSGKTWWVWWLSPVVEFDGFRLGHPSDKSTEFHIFSFFDHPGSMEVKLWDGCNLDDCQMNLSERHVGKWKGVALRRNLGCPRCFLKDIILLTAANSAYMDFLQNWAPCWATKIHEGAYDLRCTVSLYILSHHASQYDCLFFLFSGSRFPYETIYNFLWHSRTGDTPDS